MTNSGHLRKCTPLLEANSPFISISPKRPDTAASLAGPTAPRTEPGRNFGPQPKKSRLSTERYTHGVEEPEPSRGSCAKETPPFRQGRQGAASDGEQPYLSPRLNAVHCAPGLSLDGLKMQRWEKPYKTPHSRHSNLCSHHSHWALPLCSSKTHIPPLIFF